MEGCRISSLSPACIKSIEDRIKGLRSCSPRGTRNNSSNDETHHRDLQDIKQDQFYIEKLRQQREKIETLKQDYQSKNELVVQRQKELQKLNKELASYSSAKGNFEQAVALHEKQAYEIKRLRNEKQELEKRVTDFAAKNYKEKVNVLREEINTAYAKNQGIQIHIEKVSKLVTQARKEKEDLEHNFKDQVDNFKGKWQTLSQQFEKEKTKSAYLDDQIKFCQNKIGNLNDQLQKQKGQQTILKQREHKLKMAVDEQADLIREEKKIAERSAKALSQEYSEKEIEVSKLNNAAQKQQALIHQFKKRQKESESKLKQLTSQSHKLQDSVDKLNSDLKKKVQKINSLESQNNKDCQQMNSLRKQINQLETIEKSIKGKSLEEKRTRAELQIMRDEIKRIRREEAEKIDNLVSSFYHNI